MTKPGHEMDACMGSYKARLVIQAVQADGPAPTPYIAVKCLTFVSGAEPAS